MEDVLADWHAAGCPIDATHLTAAVRLGDNDAVAHLLAHCVDERQLCEVAAACGNERALLWGIVRGNSTAEAHRLAIEHGHDGCAALLADYTRLMHPQHVPQQPAPQQPAPQQAAQHPQQAAPQHPQQAAQPAKKRRQGHF